MRAAALVSTLVVAVGLASTGGPFAATTQVATPPPGTPAAPASGRQGAAPPAPATPIVISNIQTPAEKTEIGYTNLFNRRDLSGWRIGGPPEAFRVVEGAIVANGVAGQPCGGCGHLYYDGPVQSHRFLNFDLKLDVMAKNRSNGGIYILTEFQESGFPTKGFEIQLNNSHTDRSRTGGLYHVVDLSYVPARDDEWFPMQIMVRDQTISVWLKGEQVVQWKQPADWNGSYDTPGRKIAPGTIAFQAHDPNSYTFYTNVRIKPL